MKSLSLIIGALLRSRWRWAKTHVYAWAVLTPLVVGITSLSVSRLAGGLAVLPVSLWQVAAAATAATALLVALNLSSASAELYHVRRPEFYFEVLPVDADTHLHAALAARCLRTTVVALAVLALKWILKDPLTVTTTGFLLLFVVFVTLTETFAALGWIHWGHTRERRAAVVTVTLTALGVGLAGWLLTLALRPLAINHFGVVLLTLAAIALLYLVTRRLHADWRAFDIEYARRLQAYGGVKIFATKLLSRRLAPAVAAALARDLQLTLRGFSSAVYVVVAIAVALLIALVAVLKTADLPPITADYGWLDVMRADSITAIKIACALLTTALAVILPLLVAYELPYLWLERAAGTTGLDMYQAKLAYTRLVSLPAPLLTFTLGALTGTVPAYYLPLLFVECLLMWWALASLIGALAFEMPTRPGLALIVMLTLGIAGGVGASLSLLTSAFVLIGIYFYAQSMHGLTERGRARAKYFLMVGDD